MSATVWDDEPGPRHELRCDVLLRTIGPCTCGADDDRLLWPLLVGERGSVADRLDALPLPCEEAS